MEKRGSTVQTGKELLDDTWNPPRSGIGPASAGPHRSQRRLEEGAESIGMGTDDQDPAPLARLVEACPPGIGSRRIPPALDQLVEPVDEYRGPRARGVETRSGRCVTRCRRSCGSCSRATTGRWPPAGTTGVDSGAYGSFAVIDISDYRAARG